MKRENTSRDLRHFGWVMGGMFPLVFGLLFPWLFSLDRPWWPWGLGAAFFIVGSFQPLALGPLFVLWMRLAHLLGRVNTTILMALVFYLLVCPIGFIRRLLGKSSIEHSKDLSLKSYKTSPDEKSDAREHMSRPF